MSKQGSIDLTDIRMFGHLYIRDKDSDQILADCYNQIHFENMSVAIATSLAQQQSGFIQQMAFGNGGSIVNSAGAITYFPPNITGVNAQLYNETYRKVINNQSPLDTDTSSNYIIINHLAGTTYSDLVITCTLEYNEPSGQEAFDDASDANGEFVFDELGLITYSPTASSGYLLSHVLFNPVQKSLNREIEIVYTIRISLD
jgi:hypothetical protein